MTILKRPGHSSINSWAGLPLIFFKSTTSGCSLYQAVATGLHFAWSAPTPFTACASRSMHCPGLIFATKMSSWTCAYHILLKNSWTFYHGLTEDLGCISQLCAILSCQCFVRILTKIFAQFRKPCKSSKYDHMLQIMCWMEYFFAPQLWGMCRIKMHSSVSRRHERCQECMKAPKWILDELRSPNYSYLQSQKEHLGVKGLLDQRCLCKRFGCLQNDSSSLQASHSPVVATGMQRTALPHNKIFIVSNC